MSLNQALTLGADASEIFSVTDKFAARFLKMNQSIQSVIPTITKFNEAGKPIAATMTAVIDANTKIEVSLKKVKGVWEQTSAAIKQSAKNISTSAQILGPNGQPFRQNTRTRQADAKNTEAYLRGKFGGANAGLDPLKAAGSSNRITTYSDSIAAQIEKGGLSYSRMQQLAEKAATGINDANNRIERSVVRSINRIILEQSKATASVAAAKDKAARVVTGNNVAESLRKQAPQGLSEQVQEQINRQTAKAQRIATSSGLSQADAEKAFNLGAKPPTQGNAFQRLLGLDKPLPLPPLSIPEEKLRQAGASMRAAIQGGLSGQKVDLGKAINLAELYAAGLALQGMYNTFKSMTDEAGKFQRGVALIKTITQDQFNAKDKGSSDQYGKLFGDQLKKASENLGINVHEVSTAAYDLLSNQVTKGVDDTINTLQVAGAYARTTNSGIADSVNLLSSAINTYNLDAGDAQRISDQFFTTIDLGRVQTNEMANTFGRVAQYGQSLGVTLEELQASIITITQTGQRTDTTFTLINNLFQKLLNPTKELQTAYDELGVGTGEMFVKTYGFVGALRKLSEMSEGSKAKLAEFFNEIRAFGGIDALTSRLGNFESALEGVKNASSNSKNARNLTEDTPAQRLAQETQKLKNQFEITFGEALLTKVIAITDKLGGLATVVTVVGGSVAIFGGLVVAAYAIGPVVAWTTAVYAAAKAQTLLTASLATNPIVIALAAGAAIGFGIAKLQEYWDGALARAEAYEQKVNEIAKKNVTQTYSEKRADFKDNVTELQKELLKGEAAFVKYYANIQKGAKETAEALKNDLGGALKVFTGFLEEGVNKLESDFKKLISDVDTYNKHGKSDYVGASNKANYEAALQKNDLANQNNEVAHAIVKSNIQTKYIQLLNKEALAARQVGDYDLARSKVQERMQLQLEQTKGTVKLPNGREVLAHPDADYLRNRALNVGHNDLSVIAQEQAARAQKLLPDIVKVRNQMEQLRAEADKLKDFSLRDDSGNLIDKTEEDVKERFNEAVAKLNKKLQTIQSSVNPQLAPFARGLVTQSGGILQGQINQSRDQVVGQFGNEKKLEDTKKLQTDTTKDFQDAIIRQQRATKAAELAEKLALDRGGSAKAYGNTLANSGVNVSPEFDPTAGERFRNITEANELLQRHLNLGNYQIAQEQVGKIRQNYTPEELDKRVNIDGESVKLGEALDALTERIKKASQAVDVRTGARQSVADADALSKTTASKAAKQLGFDYASIISAAKFNTALDTASTGLSNLETIVESLRGAFKKIAPTEAEEARDKRFLKQTGEYKLLEGQKAPNVINTDPELQRITDLLATAASQNADAAAQMDAAANKIAGTAQPVEAVAKANGGVIFSPKGTDTVPAMLTPGEYVMPADKTDKYRATLESMRAGYFSDGGEAGKKLMRPLGMDDLTWGAIKFDRKQQTKRKKQLEKQQGELITQYHNGSLDYNGEQSLWAISGALHYLDAAGYASGGMVGNFSTSLSAMNSGFGNTGPVPSNTGAVNVGDINVTVNGGNTSKQTVQEIAAGINRGIRSGAIKLRPH